MRGNASDSKISQLFSEFVVANFACETTLRIVELSHIRDT